MGRRALLRLLRALLQPLLRCLLLRLLLRPLEDGVGGVRLVMLRVAQVVRELAHDLGRRKGRHLGRVRVQLARELVGR